MSQVLANLLRCVASTFGGSSELPDYQAEFLDGLDLKIAAQHSWRAPTPRAAGDQPPARK